MTLSVLFICGCLEPGHDGVGDYTRRLAGELIRKGNKSAIIALNDKYVQKIAKITQFDDKAEIPVFRVPDRLPWSKRMALMKGWIDVSGADWLSLQYVPFSFHPKGLNFGLAKNLASIGKGKKWHIMFHEICVGMHVGAGAKLFIWGMIQKHLAGKLMTLLKPAVIHTHVTIYKKQLEEFGAKVQLLPLFSNIPVLFPERISRKMEKRGTDLTSIDIVIFGGIQHGAPIRQLAAEAARYVKEKGIALRLLIIGRSGAEQAHWVDEWKAAGLTAVQLGEQAQEKIAEILADTTFGIFTTPLVVAGKSGSVAAMREHGVSLLCASRKWEARGIMDGGNPYSLLQYEEGNLKELFEREVDFSDLPTLPKVTKQFIADLLKT
jgi:hypothetical protein